eukprot:14956507-Heterocapsa_arctica.AAC.1
MYPTLTPWKAGDRNKNSGRAVARKEAINKRSRMSELDTITTFRWDKQKQRSAVASSTTTFHSEFA